MSVRAVLMRNLGECALVDANMTELATPTPEMVRAAETRPYTPNDPTLYHGIWRAMVAEGGSK